MKKVLIFLGVLAIMGTGCSSTDTAEDTSTNLPTDTSSAVETLSAEVQQIKDNMEIMQVAANTDNCEGLLIQFAPDVATEEDCPAIADFMISRQAVSQVDWSQVSPDGEIAKLVDENGNVLAEMVYDDSGAIWGYKISNRFWE